MLIQDDDRPDKDPRDSREAFAARGEAAWQQYLRDGLAKPVDAVFDRIDALFAEQARQLRADQDTTEG